MGKFTYKRKSRTTVPFFSGSPPQQNIIKQFTVPNTFLYFFVIFSKIEWYMFWYPIRYWRKTIHVHIEGKDKENNVKVFYT